MILTKQFVIYEYTLEVHLKIIHLLSLFLLIPHNLHPTLYALQVLYSPHMCCYPKTSCVIREVDAPL